jgi:hypothetical protein
LWCLTKLDVDVKRTSLGGAAEELSQLLPTHWVELPWPALQLPASYGVLIGSSSADGWDCCLTVARADGGVNGRRGTPVSLSVPLSTSTLQYRRDEKGLLMANCSIRTIASAQVEVAIDSHIGLNVLFLFTIGEARQVG